MLPRFLQCQIKSIYHAFLRPETHEDVSPFSLHNVWGSHLWLPIFIHSEDATPRLTKIIHLGNAIFNKSCTRTPLNGYFDGVLILETCASSRPKDTRPLKFRRRKGDLKKFIITESSHQNEGFRSLEQTRVLIELDVAWPTHWDGCRMTHMDESSSCFVVPAHAVVLHGSWNSKWNPSRQIRWVALCQHRLRIIDHGAVSRSRSVSIELSSSTRKHRARKRGRDMWGHFTHGLPARVPSWSAEGSVCGGSEERNPISLCAVPLPRRHALEALMTATMPLRGAVVHALTVSIPSQRRHKLICTVLLEGFAKNLLMWVYGVLHCSGWSPV